MTVRVWNQTLDPDATFAGTLTCVARIADDPTHLVAVSAAHVVAPLVAEGAQGPQEGDQIVFNLGGQQRLTGRLWFWSELQRKVDGFSNKLDAALVDIQEADAEALLNALAQPATRSLPRGGTPVGFTGSASGARRGSFDDLHSTDSLIYPVLGGTLASVVFTDSLRATLQAAPGDSGSLVTSGPDGVGLLVASEGEMCRFLPLDPLFQAFNLAWVNTSNLHATTAASVDAAIPASAVLDPEAALDTLARTLWGEARSEPLQGIRAVAAVVLNRALHPKVHWWGQSIVGVCRAPKQFSCWNGDDPNLPKLLAVTEANDKFRICRSVAQDALDGKLQAARENGATHYHTKAISPKWAEGKVPCADIGNHLFYNNIE